MNWDLCQVLYLVAIILFVVAMLIAGAWIDSGNFNVVLTAGLAFFVGGHLTHHGHHH